MGSLPTVGADNNVWGNELNAWLLADHDTDGTHSFNTWTAADRGFLAQNFDPALIGSTTGLTSGTVALARINIRYAMSVSSIYISVAAAGATLTSGQNFAGLYNATGARVAVTADQATNWSTGYSSSSSAPAIALTGAPFSLTTGFYWVAVLSVGTTPITVSRSGPTGSVASTINAGLVAGTAIAATAATGQTSLPASFTPSSNTLNNVAFWCALS